jgi:flagella basal body P-ring formation protein FlgA
MLALMASLAMTWQVASAEVIYLPVPVRNIAANEEMRSADFMAKSFEVNEAAKKSYLMDMAALDGSIAARFLRAGKPVPLQFIKKAAAVRKGREAIARYESDGIEIQGFLVPEEDGAPGQFIKVRNPLTNVVLMARVEENGSLSVGLR